jgi:1,4-dihydroxy-2-naphthoate octaprenyltransferase
LILSGPVFILFISWFIKVYRNPANANFKNMSRMTLLSGLLMLIYFGLLNII